MFSPRRIFPGYTVAGVATLATLATAPGQTFIVSQINTQPIRDMLGISSLRFNNTYALATVLAAFPLVVTGALTDRFGPRRMLAAVAIAFALGCVVMSRAQGLATLFLGFFCLRFLGQGSLALVASHSVAMWFHRRLGSISGVKIVIVFALWAFLPQLNLALMNAFGWRQTYLIFAIAIVLLVVPPALLFVRNTPEDLGLRTDNDPPDAPHGPRSGTLPPPTLEASFTLKQARRTGAYWILAVATVLPGFVGTALLFDIIPIVIEKGFAQTEAETAAANAVSVWSLTMAAVAIPAGIITDRARPSLVIVVSLVIAAGATTGILLARTPLQIAAGMVTYGLGMSLTSACSGATVARYFGRLHHGKIRSSLTRMAVIGTGLGPVATGLSQDQTGSYRPALWAFAALTLLAGTLALALRTPAMPSTDSA